ncbi:MAG: Rne/Rng family ribonuclease [Cypionkella sp.]|nr:Rne/Rng family ribonuclease [Cypionkella sp.]
MSKKMLIDATHAEETRVVVVDGNRVEEFDFETINKRQIAGNIYLAKVTRVEPSLQAAFVDYGGNRHGFLAFAEIHPDYYQIPLADRKALIEEERAFARAEEEEDNRRARPAREERARDENPRDDKPRDENSGREGGRNDRRTRGRGRGRNDARRDDTLAGGEETLAAAEQDGTNTDASGALDSADQPNSDFAPENDGDAGPSTMAHPVEGDETIAGPDLGGDVLPAASPSGMEVVDFSAEDEPQSDNDNSDNDNSEGNDNGTHVSNGNDNGQYRAIDHASDSDDEIESIAEEDIAEEIAAPRRPRARRYKIQEVIKVRQIMLVQVVKEERGNKGAALTTYLSLAGRYCVLMPNTARGGGISRKIVMAADRKKLKEIAQEIEVPEGAGLIIRTAGAKRTKPEIKRDYEYLMRLWEQIRELTLKSMAPAAIYEEGDLIKRTIRDLYSSEIDEILVEGEGGYRTAKDFMRMIMPAHAKQVVRYTDPNPLFARYGVEAYLSGMFNPTVQLKSGGYIVIGITEALVAIDVNSGRATKEGSIEDTALKTNLEAAEEVARQLRLRDLAGLIVIDFIDMEERRNNAAVEKRLKDRLKTDRARIQVGRISGFGLMEMSRQRLRPGMLESTTQPCAHCHGTGIIRSDDSLGLQVLRALEEEGTRKRSREVLLRAPIGIVNFLINNKREHIAQIESRTGMAVRIECDPAMISPDFTIEKFKTATRAVPAASSVISGNASLMGAPVAEEYLDDAVLDDVADPISDDIEDAAPEPKSDAHGDGEGGKKRRRRRRRKPRAGGQNGAGDDAAQLDDDAEDGSDDGNDATADVAADAAGQSLPPAAAALAEKPKRTRAPRGGKTSVANTAPATAQDAVAEAFAPPTKDADGKDEQAAAKPANGRRKSAAKADAAAGDDAPAPAKAAAKPARAPRKPKAAPAETTAEGPADAPAAATEPAVQVTSDAPALDTGAPNPPVPDKPRKRGWWSSKA